LNGEIRLISWKAIFYATQRKKEYKHEDAIDRFLADEKVGELLGNPFNAFPKPSQQSKSAFETKTSAINVTPSSTGRFDIKEVKEDALWLSKEANIDEISALRVTVIECQDRTFAQLLGPFSTEELAGIQDASGSGPSSVPLALFSQGADADTLQKEFESQDSRRLRLLRTYLSERHFFIKFWTYFFQSSLYHSALLVIHPDAHGKVSSFSEYDEVAQALAKGIEEPNQSLVECIGAIEIHIQYVQEGSGWYTEDGGREDLEVEWTNTHITIITQIMEVMFQIIDISSSVVSSTAVLAWLDLVAKWKFFHLNTVRGYLDPPQDPRTNRNTGKPSYPEPCSACMFRNAARNFVGIS
jgi:nuclear pore complex protein Nup188